MGEGRKKWIFLSVAKAIARMRASAQTTSLKSVTTPSGAKRTGTAMRTVTHIGQSLSSCSVDLPPSPALGHDRLVNWGSSVWNSAWFHDISNPGLRGRAGEGRSGFRKKMLSAGCV